MVVNMIVKVGDKWYVKSKDGSKTLGGPYDTRDKAVDRLQEIEHFAKNGGGGIEYIITNLVGSSGLIRNEKLEGRDYLVVPMIMMVEGVLNGSNGPLYYPAEELAKVPQVWNHKPIVVYHPTMNGKSLSACDPDVINTHKVGIIMNTSFDGKKLKSEAWLEESRIKLVDSRVMLALQNNNMMEVSTGLFTENENTPGEFNGTHYDAIARNYRPDHLAILPDQIGACSIADGAGLLRVNATNTQEMKRVLQFLGLSDNEASHDEIRQALYSALDPMRNNDSVWIEDIYDTWFVYHKNGSLYKQDYRTEEDTAIVSGVPVQVERKIVYQDTQGILVGNQKKEMEMNKKEFIDQLIKNTAWTEEDRRFLEGLNEDQLTKMGPTKNEETPPTEPTPKKEDAPVAPVAPVAPAPAVNKEQSAEEWLATAPAGIREVVNDAMHSHVEKKKQLIQMITANKKNIFTKEQLSAMNINELTAIAALAEADIVAPSAPRGMNFGGMAPVGNTNGNTKEEPLVAPTMNFDPVASGK